VILVAVNCLALGASAVSATTTTSAGPAAGPAGKARLVRSDGRVVEDPGAAELTAAAGGQEPFWLDLTGVSPQQADWLQHVLGLHPLVVEDAQQFGEHPKLELFDDYIAVVIYGCGPDARLDRLRPSDGAPGRGGPEVVDVSSLDMLSEVHCIVSAQRIITVHRGDCPAMTDAAHRVSTSGALAAGPAAVFYQVADALTDSLFPLLGELDDRLDTIEAEIMRGPRGGQLAELGAYRSALIPLRKVLTPQEDIFATLASGKVRVPGAGDDQLPYLRDIHDHIKKLSDLADSFRDVIAGVASAYSSAVSNQLNVVMKQLAVISTVFLPLTFLTGFFGQNFGTLVGHINSWQSFLIFGVGTEVVAVALLYLLFWRRGWLRS
jgi:magnesium transporter